MRKLAASVVTAGILVSGAACASPEDEPQPTAMTSVTSTSMTRTTNTGKHFDQAEIATQRESEVAALANDGLNALNAEIGTGTARVSYDQDNCIVFSGVLSDVIVRNPVKRSITRGDSTLTFLLFIEQIEGVGPVLSRGPYEHFVPELNAPLSGDDSVYFSVNEVTDPELSPVIGIESDGQSAWLQAGDGVTRLSETVVIKKLENGEADTHAIGAAAVQLCGQGANSLVPPLEYIQE